MSRVRRCWYVAIGVVTVGWAFTASAAYRDDEVKAAYLFRFTSYVEWPPVAMQSTRFTIAVLGSPEVATELGRLFARYPVKNLPGRVRVVQSPEQARECHVLFVGAGYAGSVQRVVDAVRDVPVLVVTDTPQGLDEGSALNFLVVDRRVRFEVSLAAAARAKLRVSSQMLAVATRVRGASIDRRHEACKAPAQPGLIQPDPACGVARL